MKFTNAVETVLEPSKDGSGNWYWAVKIDGEVYADGEEGTRDLANNRLIRNLDKWKQPTP